MGKKYDFDKVNDRKEVWYKLKDDNNYNISMIALVLMWGVRDRNYGKKYWSYSETQTKKLLAIYQGTDQYGEDVYNCYKIFDYYNQIDNRG